MEDFLLRVFIVYDEAHLKAISLWFHKFKSFAKKMMIGANVRVMPIHCRIASGFNDYSIASKFPENTVFTGIFYLLKISMPLQFIVQTMLLQS